MRKNKIEKLKKKLNRAIENYGRDSSRVLKISQQLDKYIVKEMKKNKKRPQFNHLGLFTYYI